MPILPDSVGNTNSSSSGSSGNNNNNNNNNNKSHHSDSSRSSKQHASSSSSQSRVSRPSSIPQKPQSKFFSLSSAAKQSYMNGKSQNASSSSSLPPPLPTRTNSLTSSITAAPSLSQSAKPTAYNPTADIPPEDLSEAETVIAEDSIPQKKLKRLKRRRSSIPDDSDSWSSSGTPAPPPPRKRLETAPKPSTSQKRKSSPVPQSKSSNNRSTSPRPVSGREALLRKHAKSGRDANGRLRLQRMCDKGKYDDAKELILMGADVNDRDYAGNTAIHEAALKGHIKIVELLLDHGAIIDVRSGPGDLDTPLIDAASNDHIEVVKLLLGRGADPRIYNAQGKTSMDLVQDDKPNHKEIERLLRDATLKFRKRKHDSNKTPEAEDLDTPDFMDPANSVPGTFPSPDFYSNHHNTQSGSSHADVSGPRRRGARAQSIRNDLLWMDLTTRTGRDQVYRRAADGDYEFVGNFLENGWKPDADCLALAARHGHRDVVNLLLAFGADSNGITEEGDTPLQQTVGRGHYGTVKLLLDAGANPTVLSKKGKTLYDMSKESLTSDDKELALISQSIQSWKQTKKNNTSTPTTSVSPPPPLPESLSSKPESRGRNNSSSDSEPRKLKKRKTSEPSNGNTFSQDKPKSKPVEIEKKPPPSGSTTALLFGKDDRPKNQSSFREKEKSKSHAGSGTDDKPVKIKKESADAAKSSEPKKTDLKRRDSQPKAHEENRPAHKEKDASQILASLSASATPAPSGPKKPEKPEKSRQDKTDKHKETPGEIKNEKAIKQEKIDKLEKLEKPAKPEKPEKSSDLVEKSEPARKHDKLERTNSSSIISKIEKIKQDMREKKSPPPAPATRAPPSRPEVVKTKDTPKSSDVSEPASKDKEPVKQKEVDIQEQRERSRREREKKMLQQIEEEEKRVQEKKRRDEEAARQERARQEQEEEKRRAEQAEREQERARRQQQRADAEMRRNLPYGLRVAVYGPRPVDEACKVLPLLMRTSRSGIDKGGYVVDLQVSLLLGIQNLYQVYPELSKKLVTDQEKARLWTLLSAYLCKPVSEFAKPVSDTVTVGSKEPVAKPVLSSTVNTDEVMRDYSEDRRKFLAMSLFWLRCDQVEEIMAREHAVLYELSRHVGSVAMDLDYDDARERRACELAAQVRRRDYEQRTSFVRHLPMRLRVKLQSQDDKKLWGQ